MLYYYQHPTCSTCRKGRNWLDQQGIAYEAIDMIAAPPSKEQLMEWMTLSDLPIARFFNTSSNRYRELGLKETVPTMDKETAAALLATDGMLIKRPLVTNGKKVTVGFKEERFEKEWLTSKGEEK